MKLSKKTLSILKSFSAINPVLYFGDPKAIKVISPDGGVIGCYQSDESINQECSFWETPKLLATIDSMGGEEAELDFNDKFVKIVSNDKSSLKYFYTPEAMILSSNPKPKSYEAYCKSMEMNAEFELPIEMFSKIMKLSQVMQLNNLKIEFENDKGKLFLLDDTNKVAHNFEYEIDGKGTGSITLYISSLNIIPGTYNIVIKSGLFTKFTNKDIPLFYIVAGKKEQK